MSVATLDRTAVERLVRSALERHFAANGQVNGKPSAHLLTLLPAGSDWVAWTPQGYYAATPGGERLMGWKVEHGDDRPADFYPAERFRKQLYRPDVVKLLLAKGSIQAYSFILRIIEAGHVKVGWRRS